MEELIERLRWFAEYEADLADESKWERIEWEAADMLETQSAKIQQMALEYISEQGQWIDEIAKYKALCDQLGNALQNCANNEDDVMLTREALAAWREMEGGCDVPNSE